MRPQVEDRTPAVRLRHICAELERRLLAGENYRSEDVFASDPELAINVDAALEVIYTEYVTRDQLGQQPSRDDVLSRFPQYQTPLEQLFEVHRVVGDMGDAGDTVSREAAAKHDPGESHRSSLDHAAPRRVGSYELLEEIGRGGMGIVYKARQVGLNRFVALKMILSGVDAGPRDRARFRAEAEAAARLQHPGIVQVHEIGEHDGHPFLVFEYLAGGNLEQRLDGKPWPAFDAARLVESLAVAVQHAHDHGIIHRDLKPANILITRPQSQVPSPESSADRLETRDCRLGTPKVSDFGLARQFDADQATPRPGLTVTGTIVGTPAYMAPEQTMTGSSVGPAADVYSLGAVLYELMTGRPPFQGVDVLDTLDQVRSRDPVPPRRLVSVPRDLETICLKCLRKDARQRYASAADLRADLRRFLVGEPVRARPSSPWERGWKWAKRRPTVATLLGTLTVVLVAGIITVSVLWRQTAAALITVRDERNEKEAALASTLVTLAHRDWVADDFDSARKRLDQCPPAYRDAQWRYLSRACNSRLIFLPGESANFVAVQGLAWSPDGKRLAVLHMGPVHVWDVETAKETCPLTIDRPPPIRQIAFASDNELVTVGSPTVNMLPLQPTDRNKPFFLDVRRWDVTTGSEISGFPIPCTRTVAYLSSDGQRMAYCCKQQLVVLDLAIGPTSARSFDAQGLSVIPSKRNAISRDGQLFACGPSSGPVLALDTRSGATVGLPVGMPTIFPGLVVFSADNNLVAVSYRQENKRRDYVTVRNLHTGQEISSFTGHTLGHGCIAFDADGSRIATGGVDKTAILWDARTGRELLTMRGQDSPVTSVEFSPDNSRLAVGCHDGSIHIWDVRPFEDR